MKRLCLLLIFCLPYVCLSQKNQEYLPYKQKADSMMMHFFGYAYRYVQLDYSKSRYSLTEAGHIKKAPFKKRISFKPAFFTFHYVFRHPRLGRETFHVTFTLDTLKYFVPDSATYGLVDATDLIDSLVISREQALYHSQNSIKGSIKPSTITLIWYDDTVSFDQYNRTKNIRDIHPGRMVWEVKAVEKFRGKLYDGVVRVDVITGEVARVFAIPWD